MMVSRVNGTLDKSITGNYPRLFWFHKHEYQSNLVPYDAQQNFVDGHSNPVWLFAQSVLLNQTFTLVQVQCLALA